jgi:hypothetical protein
VARPRRGGRGSAGEPPDSAADGGCRAAPWGEDAARVANSAQQACPGPQRSPSGGRACGRFSSAPASRPVAEVPGVALAGAGRRGDKVGGWLAARTRTSCPLIRCSTSRGWSPTRGFRSRRPLLSWAKSPTLVRKLVADGRIPRHGRPRNGRPLLLSEVEALRDKGDPIRLRDAAAPARPNGPGHARARG